jgi:hypothetical protein
VLGLEHTLTLSVASNLGSVYHAQGRQEKEEEIHKRILTRYTKVSNNQHVYADAQQNSYSMGYGKPVGPSGKPVNPGRALKAATQCGDEATMRLLLDKGASVNAMVQRGGFRHYTLRPAGAGVSSKGIVRERGRRKRHDLVA